MLLTESAQLFPQSRSEWNYLAFTSVKPNTNSTLSLNQEERHKKCSRIKALRIDASSP